MLTDKDKERIGKKFEAKAKAYIHTLRTLAQAEDHIERRKMEEYAARQEDEITDFIFTTFDSLLKEKGKFEVCVCAAVKADDGSVYRGHRHGHCIQAIRDEGKEMSKEEDGQGFITTKNRFVTRVEGLRLQKEAGIPSADKEGYRYMLFSEDLYQRDKDSIINGDKQ